MSKPAHCPNCGIPIRPGAKHCDGCGALWEEEIRKPEASSSKWGDLDLGSKPEGAPGGQERADARPSGQQANIANLPTMMAEPGAGPPGAPFPASRPGPPVLSPAGLIAVKPTAEPDASRLQAPPPAVSAPAPGEGRAARQARPEMLGEGSLGRLLEDPLQEDALEGPGLELELERPRKKARRAARAAEKEAVEESPEAAQARKKAELLRQIGGYGVAPTKLFEYPLYALRVLWRQYRLRSEVKALNSRKQQPSQEMNRALRAAGEAMYNMRSPAELQAYGERIRAIDAADRNLSDLKSGREKARVSSVEQMKETTRLIQEAQRRAEPLRSEESRLLQELGRRQEVMSQLKEMDRKAEDEHRALGQSMTGVPDAGWMASVEGERRERRGKMAEAQSEIDATERQLREVREKLAGIKAEVDSLSEQRKAFAGMRAQDERQFETRSGEIQQSREASLVELGRLGMEQKLENVADLDFESARKALSVIGDVDREIELRRQALETYQPRPFHAGLGLLAAALALLIALYAGLSALFHEDEPYQWEYLEKERQSQSQ
jgi:hypothetical protein